MCKIFLAFAKSKSDDGIIEHLLKSAGCRISAQQNPEHEVEDHINEWANMTGFLCALGGICWEQPPAPPEEDEPTPSTSTHHGLSAVPALISSITSSGDRNRSQNKEKMIACPVTQFVDTMLRLLTYNNEKFGPIIQKNVKELAGCEMSPALYPKLFERIKMFLDKFFDGNGQAIITDANTYFVEHIIFILKSIFGNNRDEPSDHLGMTNVEGLLLSIVRYVRHLDVTVYSIHLKTKLCKMVEVMMKRRDELSFRQEVKFRNKLVDYLAEWVMGTSPQISPSLTEEIYMLTRDLDEACMEAIGSLLRGLPLHPVEADRSRIMEAKNYMFLKFFTLFMNLLNDCSDAIELDCDNPRYRMKLIDLRNVTIQAMSNLLSANIDSGLRHSIDLGYNKDLQTRTAFMEVLTRTLQQGTEFETLADTILADRYEQLVQLVTMIGDNGELPIAMALAHVVTNTHMDELARVFVTIFDSKHLLSPLLWNMFYREVELADSMQTLFRGNSLGSKVMAFCFKIYGASYLQSLLQPLILPLLSQTTESYEIDPARTDNQEIIEPNREKLKALTQTVFDAIISSAEKFPAHLRSMCHCLYQVLSKKYPSQPHNNIGSVGTVLFLRFINPAIVSPKELGIVSEEVPPNIRRVLMLVSKILQSIANHVEFSKEKHMLPFNDFLRENFEAARRFFVQIASDSETVDQTSHSMSFISDVNIVALHRLLWLHQEKIGEYLTSSKDQKAIGKRPFHKLVTLLAHLGPPEYKTPDSQYVAANTQPDTQIT